MGRPTSCCRCYSPPNIAGHHLDAPPYQGSSRKARPTPPTASLSLSLFLHLRLLFFISVADIKDSAAAAPFQAAAAKSQIPEPEEKLRCPRCDSTNTKFCYYNNYNLFQPRHFCKSCRRYWTKGGALRNVPIGGGTRKRSKAAASSSSSASSSKSSSPPKPGRSPSGHAQPEPISVLLPPFDADRRLLDTSGSFISLLASSGRHFGGPSSSFLPGGGASAGMRNPSNVSISGVDGHEWELHNFTGSNVYESIAATLSTESLSFDLSSGTAAGVGKEFGYDGRGGDGDRKGRACIGPERLWRTAMAIGGGGRGELYMENVEEGKAEGFPRFASEEDPQEVVEATNYSKESSFLSFVPVMFLWLFFSNFRQSVRFLSVFPLGFEREGKGNGGGRRDLHLLHLFIIDYYAEPCSLRGKLRSP
ncbi:hypothetical protein GW17_00003990 [Ensete ventricosum]|nr:hypothetical protein GW17_00003990 [Ensete ventricosum]